MLLSGPVSTPRRRGRCYSALMLALVVVVVNRSAAVDRRRATTMDICQRDPPDIRVDSMPGDHGFRIQIHGHAVRYTPGQVYTVSVGGSYTDQRLEGFMLVAVPLNAQDETTAMGTFQHIDADETQFVSECPHVVTEVSRRPRSNVDVVRPPTVQLTTLMRRMRLRRRGVRTTRVSTATGRTGRRAARLAALAAYRSDSAAW